MSITLTLEIQEVEAVVAGLRKLPMELIEETVNKIKIQAIPQIQAAQTPVAEDEVSSAPETPAAEASAA